MAERSVSANLGDVMDIDIDLFDEEVKREIARRSLHEFIQYINPNISPVTFLKRSVML